MARTPLFFHFCKENAEHQDHRYPKNLSGDAVFPNLRGPNFQSGGSTTARSAPWNDIHNAHRQGRDTEQCDGAHIQLFIDREQRRDRNKQCGSAGAIQMTYKGDQDSCKHQQQDVSANYFQYFVYDAVKDTRIVHHAKKQDRKNEQDRSCRNARHTRLDVFAHVRRAESDCKTNNDGQQYKHDRRRTFPP